METKTCLMCKEDLPLLEYYARKASEDGKHYYCKGCCKIQRSREGVRKRDKKVKISNRQNYRARIGKIKSDPDITLDGVYRKDHGICQVCKLYVMPKHASIDHTHPLSKGGTHTWDNVQLVHLKCNLRKGAS